MQSGKNKYRLGGIKLIVKRMARIYFLSSPPLTVNLLNAAISTVLVICRITIVSTSTTQYVRNKPGRSVLRFLVIQTQETILWSCVQNGDVQNTSQSVTPSDPTKQSCHPAHTPHIQLQAAPISSRFDPRLVHLGFLVNKVALVQVYLPVPYLPIHQRSYVILTQNIISNYNISTKQPYLPLNRSV